MKLYQLGKDVCRYYRSRVRGNEETSHEQVQRKLTRNVLLAFKVNDEHYVYGNLHIYLKGNTITRIKNHKRKCDWFFKDENKYKELNVELVITN